MIDRDEAARYLRGEWTINSLLSVTSTQTPAKDAARDGADRCVWATDDQRDGRGRNGRSWTSAPGLGLAFSVVVRPRVEARYAGAISLVSSLAVQRALRDIAPEIARGISIKWPNDVLSDGRKLCGVICESATMGERLLWAVIGIGINVYHDESELPIPDSPDRPRPASLASEMRRVGRGGASFSLSRLLALVLNELDVELARIESADGRARAADEYVRACSTIGGAVRVITDSAEHVGRAVGISESGELILDSDGEERAFAAADVARVRKE